jgi:flagellar assembly factor FliW
LSIEEIEMKFTTERFGVVDINPDEIFDFPLGIIGFSEYRRYGFHHDEKLSPFLWLQSLEEPRLCFFVVEPFFFFNNYEIEIKLEGILERDLNSDDELLVLVICTIAQEFKESTANLLAPLIVNKTKRVAYQIVLERSEYQTKHVLFETAKQETDLQESAVKLDMVVNDSTIQMSPV